MSQVASLPLCVVQGATYEKPFWYGMYDKTTKVFTPLDLTGYTAEMVIESTVQTPTITLTLTTANGGLVIDGPAGKITRHMTAAQTGTLAFSRAGKWQLEITSGAVVKRLAQGAVIVERTL